MKTPDYVLNEEVKIMDSLLNEKVLPAGSFVKPIEPYYLPKHIKDQTSFHWFDPRTEAYCYTFYGIVMIPLRSIRRASE